MTASGKDQAVALVLKLADFEQRYGSVLGQALDFYARHMRDTAAQAQAGYEAVKDQPEQPPVRDGDTISITPTASGWRGMARLFAESADKADAAAHAYELLAGQAEQMDNDGII
jgi:hypothetical protein